jgi:hypothetical protein
MYEPVVEANERAKLGTSFGMPTELENPNSCFHYKNGAEY